uniref:Metalloproteinase inhibitor n=1 Tax=Hemiscorpius lepturus TaxID=520031 RepID=A0A4P2UE22_HEMLE|nr:metalloproteinase inhibitor [Hemiscorpius lepturus]
MKIANVFVWILRASFLITFLAGLTEACSCMLHHPQEHYCAADYVALVKVIQQAKGDEHMTAYHIKVKKEFKMTEKARHALSQGLIFTPRTGSLCGRSLKHTRYLITGRVDGKKAFLSLCDLAMEWTDVTHKQKRGFRRLYQQGCHCKVKNGMFHRYISRQQNKNQCLWDTASFREPHLDCQKLHSFCAPSARHDNRCVWLKGRAYRQCMKERAAQREREP